MQETLKSGHLAKEAPQHLPLTAAIAPDIESWKGMPTSQARLEKMRAVKRALFDDLTKIWGRRLLARMSPHSGLYRG